MGFCDLSGPGGIGRTAAARGSHVGAALGESPLVSNERRNFNAAATGYDMPNFARTLTYPHVRVASGGVTVFPDRQSFINATDLNAFAKRFNWSHSRWDSIATVQADAEKVHFAVQFTRFNPEGEAYVSFNSLYILQRTESGWGIRARSSFAP